MLDEYFIENYGFPEDKIVKLNPKPNFKLNMLLSSEKQLKLKEIFQLKEAPLMPLLEDIVKIVNDSIEYSGKDSTAKYLIKKSGYQPTGEETAVGDCADAGINIRHILYALGLENVDFMQETCGGLVIPNMTDALNPSKLVTHDCTVVYDRKNWVVLNSKSSDPNKQFYVAPKDKLAYMGPPFVSEEEYKEATGNFLSAEERAWIKNNASYQNYIELIQLYSKNE